MNTTIDLLVLTAANTAQARGYEAQLRARQAQRALDDVRQWCVVPDPGGRRVGSGGSTLWVLHEAASRLRERKPDALSLAELFEGVRILVIHSGGDSRRLVAYTAQGKVFTPLPCSMHGQPATLLDLMLADLAALPCPARGQVLLAAGDVLLTFDHSAVRFDAPGVVGVAYPGPAERGAKHGVYVADADGKVTRFLQKPDPATAAAQGAVDPAGRVLVDTGLVSLDPATSARWLEMAGVELGKGRLTTRRGLLRDLLDGRTPPIDLYEQLLIALPPRTSEAAYLAAVADASDAAHRQRLAQVYRSLRRTPFSVNVLPYCEFFHIGTSRELLGNINTLNRTARTYGFSNQARAVVRDTAALDGCFIYNSILTAGRQRTGSGVLIEACHTAAGLTLPGQNIVVGLPPQVSGALQLPVGWGLVCLPVKGPRDPWAAVVFGADDDFKTPLDRGGTFGNQPMQQMLDGHGVAADKVWEADDVRTLWDAKLWAVGPIGAVLRQALQWTRRGRCRLAGRHWSMRELLLRVDHDRLLAHREEIRRLGELHHLAERVTGDVWLPAAGVAASIRSRDEARLAQSQVDTLLHGDPDPLLRARLQWLRSVLPGTTSAQAEHLRRESLASVASSVWRDVVLPEGPRPAAILPDQVVWATTPVRIDFAGGWSDTPPICAELGGAVVNAAITLNGQYPVQVMAKLSEGEPVVTLSSIDLGQRVVLRTTDQVLGYTDPRDWAALPKAVLVLAGIAPSSPKQSLRTWLTQLGGGLDVTMFSALPKGSGLGTSSVLGAAMLACLARVRGESVGNDTLIQRTSLLEQMMTTGGGWQDQAGGITPGVKLIRTEPGPLQLPGIHWTGAELERNAAVRSRLLLYFTGQKRMAKNILQNVVGRYLARDPQAIEVIHRLKIDANQMKADLDAGDFTAWAAGVERYWQLKQTLDKGSTNARIEAILKPVNRYLEARLLPGAGGGGFVFMVARDDQAAGKVRDLLTRKPANPHARFFNFDFDPHGLRVTVL